MIVLTDPLTANDGDRRFDDMLLSNYWTSSFFARALV